LATDSWLQWKSSTIAKETSGRNSPNNDEGFDPTHSRPNGRPGLFWAPNARSPREHLR
jgi:hypothetical protein